MSGAAVLPRGQVDLLGLVQRDTRLKKIAGTRGGEYAGPCPNCGGDDRFRVQPEQGLWWCRSCRDRWSDAIDYVRWRSGCSFVDACRELGVNLPDRPPVTTARATVVVPVAPEPPTLADDAEEPSAAWRVRGDQYVAAAEAALWSYAGTRARRWLTDRGLSEESIRRWRLGYQPADAYDDPAAWGLEGKRIWLPRGIVIPWYLDGQLWQIKFRRPDPAAPKYVAVRGGTPVLFGAETLQEHGIAVLPEGEFDAMLLEQHCGDLVGVATLGSASRRPDALAAECLLSARTILTLHDGDAEGERGAERLSGLTSRAVRIRVPIGKDATDFVKAGGDLRAWLLFELDRIGLLDEEVPGPPSVATTVSVAGEAPERQWRGVQVRWGRERGDIAVQDPVTGEWHEMAYRDAPRVWQAAVREAR